MKILLLQLKRIGDLILTTPAFAALREKFPDAQITLVVAPGCAPLIPAIPYIDNIYVAGDWRVFWKIGAGRFDWCIDFTRNDRSAFLATLSGAARRVAIKRRSKARSLIYNNAVDSSLRLEHTIDVNLALLAPLGIKNPSRKLQLDLPDSARESAADVRAKYNIDSLYVVFHPGSARAEKFWEPSRWAEVIDHAAAKWNCTCVLTGGSDNAELDHFAEIKSRTRASVVDLAGKIDILTLAALFERARMLVTVDTASLHLAAALGTPQVALFGPTNPFHWRPLESAALILQGDSQRPLTEFQPKQEPRAMNQISTAAVIDAMESLLSDPAMRTSAQLELD